MSDMYAPPQPLQCIYPGESGLLATSPDIGPGVSAVLEWDRPTSSHLEGPATVISDDSLGSLIRRVCSDADLTRADFAAILDRDRRNVANWASGRQGIGEGSLLAMLSLKDLVVRLNGVQERLAAAVLSPRYGHPSRDHIIDLIRVGQVDEALALALEPKANAEVSRVSIATESAEDFAKDYLDRRSAPYAFHSSAERPDSDDDHARMRRLLGSRARRGSI
jgi:hypothetical protein